MKNMFQEKGGQRITLISLGIVLILVSIISIIWFFLSGQTIVTGDFDKNEYSTSLTCVAENLSYPYFKYDNTIKKETEIKAIFNNDNKIDSISLTQKMYYENADAAKGSEASNHASMNESFSSLLGPDALNVNYYVNDGVMRMSLYASKKEYSINSRKYFLIDAASETLDSIEKNYTNKGFGCEKVTTTN